MKKKNPCTLNPNDRQEDDFYATPKSTIQQLLEVEKFENDIWEPACGDGAISKVLIENNYNVISTDLIDRNYGISKVDFLLEQIPRANNIITNPPFKLATEFAKHALELSTGKVAMLLKIGFLEGPTKQDLHKHLINVWVIRRRITFLKNGKEFSRSSGKGGIHTYAWFVWDKNKINNNEVKLGWLEGEPCK